MQGACLQEERPRTDGTATVPLPSRPPESQSPHPAELIPPAEVQAPPISEPAVQPSAPVPRWDHGWPIPSTISLNPDEARACIQLPEFDALTLEKARVISGRFPHAEAEYRSQRGKQLATNEPEIPH